MNICIIEVYKDRIVEFQGDCYNRICKEFGLESLINCHERKKGGIIKCDADKLIDFAIAVKKKKIELTVGVVCPHKICVLSNDCAGTKERENASFYCYLEDLINMAVKKKDESIMRTNQLQFSLFK